MRKFGTVNVEADELLSGMGLTQSFTVCRATPDTKYILPMVFLTHSSL